MKKITFVAGSVFICITIAISQKNDTVNLFKINANVINIDSVYENGNDDTIFFDTPEHKRNMLVCCKDSVWIVVSNSKNYNWVMVSRMPLDPAEAYGRNERLNLYYMPKKKNITTEDLGYKASNEFLGIIEKNSQTFVVIDNDTKEDTVNLSEYLKKKNF